MAASMEVSEESLEESPDPEPFGMTSLVLYEMTQEHNLSLEDVYYEEETFCTGCPMEFTASIANHGTEAVPASTLEICGSDGSVLASKDLQAPLLPGCATEASISYVVPEDVSRQDIRLKVMPKDVADADETDNIKEIHLSYDNLSVEQLTCGWKGENTCVISADIVNRGYDKRSGIKVSLRKDSETGTEIATEQIDRIEPMDLETVSFEVNAKEGEVYYVVIDEESDPNLSGNSEFLLISLGEEEPEEPKPVIIQTISYPKNAGLLTGGGEYTSGDKLTLTAKPVKGYTFLGWYKGNIEEGTTPSETNIVATTPSFELAAPQEDTTYTAYFTANASRNLSIFPGNGSVTYTLHDTTDTITADMENQSFPMGAYVTVNATPSEGYEFLYWTDASTGRILSEKQSYSFYLSDNTSLRAFYKSAQNTACYVVFKDLNGKVLWAGDVQKGAAAEAPQTGNFTGYTFSGWDKDFTNVQKDLVINAVYEKQTGYKLTVIDGSILSGEKDSYAHADIVTVKAEETQGEKHFSGWYADDVLVSDSLEYTFAVTKSMTLTAKYEAEEAIEQQPVLGFVMEDRTELANGKQTVVMDVSWSVPEGYTFNGAGLLRTLDDIYRNDLTLEKVDGANVKKNSTKLSQPAGTYEYTLTQGTASKGKDLHARAYLIVTDDKTGEVRTLYSDIATSMASGNP